MNPIRCILLEDEEPSRNLICHYAKQMPEIELVEVFDNALEAFDFLKYNSVDLIITDIEMPRLSGMDFIKMLSPRPLVIIITANSSYAPESFDLELTDYIVKPVTLERFKKAIEKAIRLLPKNEQTSTLSDTFIFVKENGKTSKVELEQIIYVEAFGDYVKIITQERTIITLSTMNKMEENLPSTIFVRVHKSSIVNFNKIESLDAPNSLAIMKDKTEINLGRTHKSKIVARFKAIN